jgi:glycosyltransferase involved in cell wall biosynthesis
MEKMNEFWKKISHTYGLSNDLEEIIRNRVVDLISMNLGTERLVLDLGCGNGRVLDKIYKKINDIDLTGVDSSASMLSECSKIGITGLKLFESDVINFIKSSNNSFNFVLAVNTLHNLSSRSEIEFLLKNVYQIIENDGLLIFDIRNKFNPFISRGYKKNRNKGYSFFTFSYLKAKRILKSQGFVVESSAVYYNSVKHADKDNLNFLKKFFYKIYLKITRIKFFSPYILIVAKKKPKKFVSIIWGYHSQLAKLSPIENYHLHDIKIAVSMGYDVSVFSISSSFDIKEDPNFPGDIKVLHYKSLWQYILVLFKNRKSIIYANTYTWQSFLAPFICGRVIFMGHDSVARKKIIKQLFQDFVFRFFYKIRVISEEEKQFLLKRGVNKEKIFVAPLTVDINQFMVLNNSNRKNLVFLGNVTPDKNINDILRALVIVKNNFSDLKLEIIGEIRDNNFYKIIDECDLKDNIIVHGFVPHSCLRNYLEKTLIYVNSSISEGQCLAVYEAVLSGNALCLPKTISFKGVFDNLALFHDLYNYKELADNIIKYLEDSSLLKKNIENSQRFVSSNYNEDVVRKKTVKLFSF